MKTCRRRWGEGLRGCKDGRLWQSIFTEKRRPFLSFSLYLKIVLNFVSYGRNAQYHSTLMGGRGLTAGGCPGCLPPINSLLHPSVCQGRAHSEQQSRSLSHPPPSRTHIDTQVTAPRSSQTPPRLSSPPQPWKLILKRWRDPDRLQTHWDVFIFSASLSHPDGY